MAYLQWYSDNPFLGTIALIILSGASVGFAQAIFRR